MSERTYAADADTGPTPESDPAATDDATRDHDPAALAQTVDALSAENRRLRREYSRSRRATYRRTALGLAGVGVVAAALSVVFPSVRTVLIALGGTGLFAGVLTYYLTPEQFIPANVGKQAYDSFADNVDRLVDQLELSDARVYVPVEGTTPARLFIPQHAGYELPPREALDAPLVITDDDVQRGLSLTPTGAELFVSFEHATESLEREPEPLSRQLSDMVVEQFELAKRMTVDVDPDDGRAIYAPRTSIWGDLERVDHLIPSLLAVGFAVALDRPIELEVTPGEGGGDALITLRWDTDTNADARTDAA